MEYYIHKKRESFQAKLYSLILSLIGAKKMIRRDLIRGRHKKSAIPRRLNKKREVHVDQIRSNKVWTIKPRSIEPQKTILFLHGGAYLYGMQRFYWRFIDELIDKTHSRVIIPDYPLAPESTASETFLFMEELYGYIAETYEMQELIFMGDSAGGGLALGFTQWLRNVNKTLPAQLILISPWLDVALTNPAIKDIESKDKVLEVTGLRLTGAAYRGDWHQFDYRVSPIHGKFNDLPPISIFIGGRDILYPDAEKLRVILEELDLPAHFYLYPQLFHDWPVIAPKIDESKQLVNQIVDLLKLY